jgi:glycerophosphoryl diester phosphodiesterase
MHLGSATLLLFVSFTSGAFEWIAHRGNARAALENSVEAVKASWSIKADAIELDVRVSKDGIVYLFHDSKIGEVALADLSFSEIKKINPSIPTLSMVLELENISGYYVLDLKHATNQNIPVYVDTILEAPISHERVAFQSENIELLDAIRKLLPDSRYYYLERLERSWPFYGIPKPQAILKNLANSSIETLSIKDREFIDENYIQSLKSTGLRVYVWTINDKKG